MLQKWTCQLNFFLYFFNLMKAIKNEKAHMLELSKVVGITFFDFQSTYLILLLFMFKMSLILKNMINSYILTNIFNCFSFV